MVAPGIKKSTKNVNGQIISSTTIMQSLRLNKILCMWRKRNHHVNSCDLRVQLFISERTIRHYSQADLSFSFLLANAFVQPQI
jgi:hypothetical protein